MGGRVTEGGGSPYLFGRFTFLGEFAFYHVKGRGRGYPPERVKFWTIGLLSYLRHL